jgi:hypothetical protein
MYCADCKKSVETFLRPDLSKLAITAGAEKTVINYRCPGDFICVECDECDGCDVGMTYITVTIDISCECGAHKIGSQTHSNWCQSFKEPE